MRKGGGGRRIAGWVWFAGRGGADVSSEVGVFRGGARVAAYTYASAVHLSAGNAMTVKR